MKRPELQGIRGLAIVLVLLFHIWPQRFPNGYIGVDIFFVLSGYLMAIIFSRITTINLNSVGMFYYKRVKRIFPLYYLCTFLIFLSSLIFLCQVWFPISVRNMMYSTTLLKNMRTIWDGNDYFTKFLTSETNRDVFLHTWSLCVEVQFYLITPFIFIALHFLKSPWTKIVLLLAIAIPSYIVFLISNPIFSFNNIFTRLWQFCFGIIAAILFDINQYSSKTCEESNGVAWNRIFAHVCCSLGILLFLPVNITADYLRTATTLLTSLLLSVNKECIQPVFSHTWLIYMGDLSFALYLVHWPVISIVGTQSSTDIQTAIVTTAALTILIHHFYEKIYLRFNMNQIFTLLAVLLIFNTSIYHTTKQFPSYTLALRSFWKKEMNETVQKAVEVNIEAAGTPIESRLTCAHNNSVQLSLNTLNYPWGLCEYPNGSGNKSVLILGNSYAINQAEIIRESFKGNYSSFKLFSNIGLQALFNIYAPNSANYDKHELMFKIVAEMKPDIIFIATRMEVAQKARFHGNASYDPIVLEYNKNIAKLGGLSTKIFIQGPHPFYQRSHINNFVDSLESGYDLERFHLNKQEADEEMFFSRSRMDAISCERCKIYNTAEPFAVDKKYLGFNSSNFLSFMDNDIHFTSAGLEVLRPVYQAIANDLQYF